MVLTSNTIKIKHLHGSSQVLFAYESILGIGRKNRQDKIIPFITELENVNERIVPVVSIQRTE